MPIVLAVLGVVAAAYGVVVMLVGSGTLFHLMWFAIGASLVALAALVASGVWAGIPMVVRRGVLVLAGAVVAAVLVSGGFVASGMNAAADAGLDYIVVLGAQVREDGPSTVLRYRLDAAYDYLVRSPGTKVVVAGGQGPNEPWTEAHGMADYLKGRGIDGDRIIEERLSTSTVENLSNSMALIRNDGGNPLDAGVGVVTNDFHVFRAVRIARKLGFGGACGIAAYSTPAYLPNNLLRESLGLIKDVLAGNV